MISGNTNISQNKNLIRFRRWSRANYAIFVSLSVCVSIGQLSANVADSSLKKQVNVIVENCTPDLLKNDTEKDDISVELLTAMIENNAEVSSSIDGDTRLKIRISNSTVDMAISLYQPFFYFNMK